MYRGLDEEELSTDQRVGDLFGVEFMFLLIITALFPHLSYCSTLIVLMPLLQCDRDPPLQLSCLLRLPALPLHRSTRLAAGRCYRSVHSQQVTFICFNFIPA